MIKIDSEETSKCQDDSTSPDTEKALRDMEIDLGYMSERLEEAQESLLSALRRERDLKGEVAKYKAIKALFLDIDMDSEDSREKLENVRKLFSTL